MKIIVSRLNIKDILHLECSALTGENIDEIFSLLSKNILGKIDNGLINPDSIMANSSFTKIKKDNLSGNNSNSVSCSKCWFNHLFINYYVNNYLI